MSKTQLDPIETFNLIRHVPKLMEAFRNECYEMPRQENLDFVPDSAKNYVHSLGLKFLEKYGIPTTREELLKDTQHSFTSVKDGDTRYNVGQFVVLFSNTIYSSGDITNNNVWVLEVLEDFTFPADQVLVSMGVEDIRLALKEHLDSGIVRIHQAGHRIYNSEMNYGFALRINKELGNEQTS